MHNCLFRKFALTYTFDSPSNSVYSLYKMNSLTGVSSFADDTKLYGEQCPQSYNTALSDSLADIVDWSHLNYMP